MMSRSVCFTEALRNSLPLRETQGKQFESTLDFPDKALFFRYLRSHRGASSRGMAAEF
jgi:hypothetical protein